MIWRPWRRRPTAPMQALDPAPAEPDGCTCQQLIDRLVAEADLLRQDLAAAERAHRQDVVRYEAKVRDLTAQLLRKGDPNLAGLYRDLRNELLRERDTNRRLAERIDLMTRGVVTL